MENKNIAKKILRVMDAVKSVGKDGFNDFHKYKYVTDSAIVTKIRRQMIIHGLICIPNQMSCSVSGDITTLHVQYTLLDSESGESIVYNVFGQGQDKGDKMVYKAATGAEKYFFLKAFMLPTDDDPENEREPKKRATKEDLDAFDKSLPPKPAQPYIGTQEQVTLFQMIKERGITQESFKDFLKVRGVEGTNKIKKEDYTGIVEWIMRQEQPAQVGE